MVLVFLILLLNCGALAGALFLWIALELFLAGAGLKLSLVQYVPLAAALFAVPLAALLTGALLERFSALHAPRGLLTHLSALSALALALASDSAVDFAAAALAAVLNPSALGGLQLFAAFVSSSIFCGALAAFAVMLVQLTAELPCYWLCSAARVRPLLLFTALRPLTVVLLAALSVNLISGLFGQELWPATMLLKRQ